MDVWTYYLNLTAANLNEQAKWQLEYKFSSTYNLSSLTPDALYGVAKKIKVGVFAKTKPPSSVGLTIAVIV